MEEIISLIFGLAVWIIFVAWLLKNPRPGWEKWGAYEPTASELVERNLNRRFMALEEAMQYTKMRFSTHQIPNSLQKLLQVSFSQRVCHIFVGEKDGLKTWFFDWLPSDGNLSHGQTVIALEVPQEGLVIPPFCIGSVSSLSSWWSTSQLLSVPIDYLPDDTNLYLLENDKYSSQWFQSLPAEVWKNYPAGRGIIYDGEWLVIVRPTLIPAEGEQIDHHLQKSLTFYQHFFKQDPTAKLHFPSST